MNKYIAGFLSAAALLACGEDSDTANPGTTNQPLVETTDGADGSKITTVRAVDRETWVYFSFTQGGAVDVAEPKSSTAWDLGFRRSNIKVNGGVSGPADVRVAPTRSVDFAALTRSPTVRMETDEAFAGEIDPETPSFVDNDATDFALGRANESSEFGWYVYDSTTRTLSASDVIYVIRAASGQLFKVEFLDYYDAQGTAGNPSFRWAPIEAPMSEELLAVDASSRESFVYVSLKTQSIVSVASPESSSEWDIALRRTLLKTNSGSSGPGLGGAVEALSQAFGEITGADTVGFDTDVRVAPPGPPVPEDQWPSANDSLSNWFDYDPATRAVSPRDTSFIVRDASGAPHKLRIETWDDGRFELRVAPIFWSPEVQTLSIDLTDTSQQFVNLRTGLAVEPSDPASDLDWDVGYVDGRLRTNGGSSGSGDGGALLLTIEGLTSGRVLPSSGYTEDGSGENTILSQVIDAPGEPKIFAVRLADGSLAMVSLDLSSDSLILDWLYAGPGRRAVW
ncbi:MAG: hypothetical protein HC923_05115 [Myxococcales bacterium]|nr:hypothetical protein [Myxococcales bacterium]